MRQSRLCCCLKSPASGPKSYTWTPRRQQTCTYVFRLRERKLLSIPVGCSSLYLSLKSGLDMLNRGWATDKVQLMLTMQKKTCENRHSLILRDGQPYGAVALAIFLWTFGGKKVYRAQLKKKIIIIMLVWRVCTTNFNKQNLCRFLFKWLNITREISLNNNKCDRSFSAGRDHLTCM